MNATDVINIMGGRAEVMRITGLTKGRISQWVSDNEIPRSWMTAFHAMRPNEIPAPAAAHQETAP
ncbi:hypothetical protein GCM10027288_18320 [Bordetella tumbae]